jgi:hypothetical protein
MHIWKPWNGRVVSLMQLQLWIGVGAFVLLAVISGIGEYRRGKRRDFDSVGLMPWQLIQVLSIIGAAMLAMIIFHR